MIKFILYNLSICTGMNSKDYNISRREFFKLVSITTLPAITKLSLVDITESEELVGIKGKGEWIPTACLICGQGCPITVQVIERNDRRVIGQVRHNFHPNSRYYSACGRPRAIADVWAHPDRIKKPMIRVGEKGSGKFREVSWKEAFDYIANKLKNYLNKPEQIIFFSHQGGESGIINSFAHLIGTPNVTKHADTCHTSSDAGRWFIFGELIGPGGFYPDYEHAKFVVFMERNPLGGFVATPWVSSFALGYSNGMRIVVFDVRYSDVCEFAEKYFLVRPGTDLAISLAIANYILQKKLYNKEYLIRYTNAPMLIYRDSLEPVKVKEISEGPKKGKLDYFVYDRASSELKFKSEAVQPDLEWEGEYEGRTVTTILKMLSEVLLNYTPEWASDISDVDSKDIIWVAEQLSVWSPRAFIDHGYKAVRYYNEPMLHRVNMLINALIGSIGVKGGLAWPRKAKPPSLFKASPKSVESIIGYWKKNGYPLASSKAYSMLAIRSILEERPYPIKVAFISLQNLVSHIPGDNIVVKALKKLDLVVVLDVMWNETCKYADVILPVPFFFEYDNAYLKGTSKGNIGQLSLMRKVIDPPEWVDVKPPREIVYELVKRLMPEKLDKVEIIMNPENVWKIQCEKLGINYDELMKYGTISIYNSPDYHPLTSKGVLKTKTGEIELINIEALKKFRDYIGIESNLNPFPVWVRPRWLRDGGLSEDEFIPIDYMNKLMAINMWARNTRLLLKLLEWEGEDKVLIHTERARKLGIKDGDIIKLKSEDGRILKVKVKTTNLLRPEIIAGVHGLTPGNHEGGNVKFTYMPKYGLNTNFLAPFFIIEGIGSAALYDFRVKIMEVVR